MEPMEKSGISKGLTIWFTGLPSSGKTAISNLVAKSIHLMDNRIAIEQIDGDVIRQTFSKGLGFSREDRDANVARVSHVAHMLTHHGIIVLVSLVSPYRQAREDARTLIGADSFIEVHVHASQAACIRRDVKGLYEQYREGKITHMTGMDDPYEIPLAPDVTCCTTRETVEISAWRVLSKIIERRLRSE